MGNNQFLIKALDYIDRNILEDIDLYSISSSAGISVPHFYRLFKRLTGDTVGAYITRRRMALAAVELINSSKSVTEVAFKYSFDSHDVFTRAFKRVYGVSPSEYRNSKVRPPLKRLELAEDENHKSNNNMSFSIIDSEGFYVMGMECEAKRWDSNGAIGRLWNDFLVRVDQLKGAKLPLVMYGICEHETCNKDSFKYMAAIAVEDNVVVPQAMVKRFIRPQRFFEAIVPNSISTPDAYAGTIGYAKSLGYQIEEYDDIEVYEDGFKDPDYSSFKLLIAVKENEGRN